MFSFIKRFGGSRFLGAVGSRFTFTMVFSTWDERQGVGIKHRLIYLLLTQFCIKTQITGQSKEITSSIEEYPDWRVV